MWNSDAGIWFIIFLLLFAISIPALLLIIAIIIKRKHKKASKILSIIAVVYTIVGLGLCGSMMH